METMCSAHHLSRYLEGQGHSMTLTKNRVRPIISLFERIYENYFDKLLLCVQCLFEKQQPVRSALVYIINDVFCIKCGVIAFVRVIISIAIRCSKPHTYLAYSFAKLVIIAPKSNVQMVIYKQSMNVDPNMTC